jgi:hypothetical protein
MRIQPQPIKVIDDFFESPELWRSYALSQTYTRDEKSTWPGIRSNVLNELNMSLFGSLASNLIKHIHDKTKFLHLKVNFALVDGSYNMGWLHQDEPHYNVAGVIYLNKDAPANSGTSFYNKIAEQDNDYNKLFFEELAAEPSEREQYVPFKHEQRKLFKRNMTVEGKFNRCIMFPPSMWHGADNYFGTTNEDSRLTIVFFGIAQ